jgi:hypothetical protein
LPERRGLGRRVAAEAIGTSSCSPPSPRSGTSPVLYLARPLIGAPLGALTYELTRGDRALRLPA